MTEKRHRPMHPALTIVFVGGISMLKMQLRYSLVAASILLCATGLSVPGSALAQEKPKVSAAAAKPLKAAQDAMNARKYTEALERLKEVEALSGKSAYDEHVMREMYGYIYSQTKNLPEAAKALEAGLNSGFLSTADANKRVKTLATMHYQLKNYDKAIEFGNRAIKGGYADDNLYTYIGQAYYLKRDFKGALNFFNGYVDRQIKAGKTPKEQTLRFVLSSCTELKDADCETRALERLISYYPKDEYWKNLMFAMFQSGGGSDQNLLHVYRLASEVNVMRGPDDYTEMAQLALEQGSPGEAQRILEKAFQKNVFTTQRDKDRNTRLLETAKKQVAANQAELAKIEKEASTTAEQDVSVGLALFGYQQYAKAVDALDRGLKKGGMKSEADARLLLGIAQLKAGRKDEATKTFRSVKGNPTLERLANLWTLHARGA